MQSPRELRREAERYQRLAATIADPRTLDAIFELAAEYEARAAALETAMSRGDPAASGRSARIRERAYRMWVEQGFPEGLHVDHWHAAEREVAGDDGHDGDRGHRAMTEFACGGGVERAHVPR